MPLVQTEPLSYLSSTRQPVEAMIDEVASMVGRRDDADARQRALVLLDRAADRLNGVGVMLFRRKTSTITTATTGVSSGGTTMPLPTDWGWPSDGSVIYDSAGDPIHKLQWLPYDEFMRQKGNTSDTGTPAYLTLKSELDDVFQVAPAYDITSWATISLAYFARVQRMSEVDAAGDVALLPETREALITGAEALWARRRYMNQPQVWMPMMRDFKDTIDLALAASKRWMGQAAVMVQPDLTGNMTDPNMSLNAATAYLIVRI